MAGWRSQSLPADWAATRRRILERDGYRCYIDAHLAGEVDHVIAASNGGSDDDSNLAAICTECHRSKTGREARAHRLSPRRPTENHPGFIH